MICYSVSCGMPVFVTYLPYQKFSRLVAGNSYETWRSPRRRLSLFRYWSRLSLFLLSDVWSLSCPNSKVCRQDFPLFVFVAAITIEPICGSGVSSKRFFTGIAFVRVDLLIYFVSIPGRMNTVIQDFESCEHKEYKRDLNTSHILTFWQICEKYSSRV